MQTLRLPKANPPLLREQVLADDFAHTFSGLEEAQLFDEATGKLILHYIPNYADGKSIGPFLLTAKYVASVRTTGVKSYSEIFGFAPRDGLKSFPCRACKFGRTYQDHYRVLLHLGHKITSTFHDQHPDEYAAHHKTLHEAASEQWVMPGSVFHSGIINHNTQLVYHYDSQNLVDTYSAMLTFKSKCPGGWLHLPEYDVLLKNMDGSLLIFSGQSVSHGVTPFGVGEGGYRFTAVWYTQKYMKRCAKTIAEELAIYNAKQNHKSTKIVPNPTRKVAL